MSRGPWIDPTYRPDADVLRGRVETDTVIVGAGVAGAALSFCLAQTGVDVVVLEAGRTAQGASGRSAGFVLADGSECTAKVAETHGVPVAKALRTLGLASRKAIRAIAGRHDMGYVQSGSLRLARDDAELADLRNTTEMVDEDLFWGLREQLPEPWRHDERYVGGLTDPGDGAIDPVRLVNGLFAESRRKARLFENSPVLQLQSGVDGPLVVYAEHGHVEAHRVVLCTNAWTRRLLPSVGPILPVRARLEHWPIDLVPVIDGAYDFGRERCRIHTNDLGRFDLSRLPAGSYAFRLAYTDDAQHVYRLSFPLEISARGPRQLTENLEIATRRLGVRIVDTEAETAVEGAHVRVVRTDLRGLVSQSVFHRDIQLVTEGFTDEQGLLELERIPMGTYDIKVASDRHGHAASLGVNLREYRRGETVTIRLAARGSAEIQVENAAGKPAVGSRVFVYDEDGVEVLEDRLLVADHLGRVIVHGLSPGRHRVQATDRRHPPATSDWFVVDSGGFARVELRLEAGGALEISCRGEDGRRLAGARVTISATTGGFQLFAAGSEPGDDRPRFVPQTGDLFITPFPVGPCRITAELEGYEPASLEAGVEAGVVTPFKLVLARKNSSSPNPR